MSSHLGGSLPGSTLGQGELLGSCCCMIAWLAGAEQGKVLEGDSSVVESLDTPVGMALQEQACEE